MFIQYFGCGADKLELHRILAFGASRERLVAEQGNFMGQAVGLVNDTINAALRNRLASPEGSSRPGHTIGC